MTIRTYPSIEPSAPGSFTLAPPLCQSEVRISYLDREFTYTHKIKGESIVFRFTGWQLLDQLYLQLKNLGFLHPQIYIAGSFASHLKYGRSFSDIDIDVVLPGNTDLIEAGKSFYQLLRDHSTQPKWSSVHFDNIFFNKLLSRDGRIQIFTLSTTPYHIDVTFLSGEPSVPCVSSAGCDRWYYDGAQLIHKVAPGYDSWKGDLLYHQGRFDVCPLSNAQKTQNGLFRYVKLLNKGLLPVSFAIEEAFIEGFQSQYGKNFGGFKKSLSSLLRSKGDIERRLFIWTLEEVLNRFQGDNSSGLDSISNYLRSRISESAYLKGEMFAEYVTQDAIPIYCMQGSMPPPHYYVKTKAGWILMRPDPLALYHLFAFKRLDRFMVALQLRPLFSEENWVEGVKRGKGWALLNYCAFSAEMGVPYNSYAKESALCSVFPSWQEIETYLASFSSDYKKARFLYALRRVVWCYLEGDREEMLRNITTAYHRIPKQYNIKKSYITPVYLSEDLTGYSEWFERHAPKEGGEVAFFHREQELQRWDRAASLPLSTPEDFSKEGALSEVVTAPVPSQVILETSETREEKRVQRIIGELEEQRRGEQVEKDAPFLYAYAVTRKQRAVDPIGLEVAVYGNIPELETVAIFLETVPPEFRKVFLRNLERGFLAYGERSEKKEWLLKHIDGLLKQGFFSQEKGVLFYPTAQLVRSKKQYRVEKYGEELVKLLKNLPRYIDQVYRDQNIQLNRMGIEPPFSEGVELIEWLWRSKQHKRLAIQLASQQDLVSFFPDLFQEAELLKLAVSRLEGTYFFAIFKKGAIPQKVQPHFQEKFNKIYHSYFAQPASDTLLSDFKASLHLWVAIPLKDHERLAYLEKFLGQDTSIDLVLRGFVERRWNRGAYQTAVTQIWSDIKESHTFIQEQVKLLEFLKKPIEECIGAFCSARPLNSALISPFLESLFARPWSGGVLQIVPNLLREDKQLAKSILSYCQNNLQFPKEEESKVIALLGSLFIFSTEQERKVLLQEAQKKLDRQFLALPESIKESLIDLDPSLLVGWVKRWLLDLNGKKEWSKGCLLLKKYEPYILSLPDPEKKGLIAPLISVLEEEDVSRWVGIFKDKKPGGSLSVLIALLKRDLSRGCKDGVITACSNWVESGQLTEKEVFTVFNALFSAATLPGEEQFAAFVRVGLISIVDQQLKNKIVLSLVKLVLIHPELLTSSKMYGLFSAFFDKKMILDGDFIRVAQRITEHYLSIAEGAEKRLRLTNCFAFLDSVDFAKASDRVKTCIVMSKIDVVRSLGAPFLFEHFWEGIAQVPGVVGIEGDYDKTLITAGRALAAYFAYLISQGRRADAEEVLLRGLQNASVRAIDAIRMLNALVEPYLKKGEMGKALAIHARYTQHFLEVVGKRPLENLTFYVCSYQLLNNDKKMLIAAAETFCKCFIVNRLERSFFVPWMTASPYYGLVMMQMLFALIEQVDSGEDCDGGLLSTAAFCFGSLFHGSSGLENQIAIEKVEDLTSLLDLMDSPFANTSDYLVGNTHKIYRLLCRLWQSALFSTSQNKEHIRTITEQFHSHHPEFKSLGIQGHLLALTLVSILEKGDWSAWCAQKEAIFELLQPEEREQYYEKILLRFLSHPAAAPLVLKEVAQEASRKVLSPRAISSVCKKMVEVGVDSQEERERLLSLLEEIHPSLSDEEKEALCVSIFRGYVPLLAQAQESPFPIEGLFRLTWQMYPGVERAAHSLVKKCSVFPLKADSEPGASLLVFFVASVFLLSQFKATRPDVAAQALRLFELRKQFFPHNPFDHPDFAMVMLQLLVIAVEEMQEMRREEPLLELLSDSALSLFSHLFVEQQGVLLLKTLKGEGGKWKEKGMKFVAQGNHQENVEKLLHWIGQKGCEVGKPEFLASLVKVHRHFYTTSEEPLTTPFATLEGFPAWIRNLFTGLTPGKCSLRVQEKITTALNTHSDPKELKHLERLILQHTGGLLLEEWFCILGQVRKLPSVGIGFFHTVLSSLVDQAGTNRARLAVMFHHLQQVVPSNDPRSRRAHSLLKVFLIGRMGSTAEWLKEKEGRFSLFDPEVSSDGSSHYACLLVDLSARSESFIEIVGEALSCEEDFRLLGSARAIEVFYYYYFYVQARGSAEDKKYGEGVYQKLTDLIARFAMPTAQELLLLKGGKLLYGARKGEIQGFIDALEMPITIEVAKQCYYLVRVLIDGQDRPKEEERTRLDLAEQLVEKGLITCAQWEHNGKVFKGVSSHPGVFHAEVYEYEEGFEREVGETAEQLKEEIRLKRLLE